MAQRPRLSFSFLSFGQIIRKPLPTNEPSRVELPPAQRVCPNATEIKVNKFPTMFGHFPSRTNSKNRRRIAVTWPTGRPGNDPSTSTRSTVIVRRVFGSIVRAHEKLSAVWSDLSWARSWELGAEAATLQVALVLPSVSRRRPKASNLFDCSQFLVLFVCRFFWTLGIRNLN